jgi:small-conductance mechanosensitive channel
MFAIVLTRTELDIVITGGVILGAVLVGMIVHHGLFLLLERSSQNREVGFRRALVRRARRPLGFIFPLVAVLAVLPDANILPQYAQPVEHLATVLTYIAVGWGVGAMVGLFADLVVARYNVSTTDNLRVREVETRVFLVTRTATVIVWLLAIAAALMTFPAIRTLGATLLASAGIAGIAAGFAARPLFENMVAGLQIAFAQPIRIDDVVVVQGQQGRIEEIRDTFVVVRLWDMRRMILPLTWFIQNPFENWTRGTAELVGPVLVYAPYTFDVEILRKALPQILGETQLWNGEIQNVQVVDVTEASIQIRALMSARNSNDLWDLRCFVRERFVALIAEHKPA